jgi:hypothetical protein
MPENDRDAGLRAAQARIAALEAENARLRGALEYVRSTLLCYPWPAYEDLLEKCSDAIRTEAQKAGEERTNA